MCHNCGSAMGLSKFLKYVDPHLYSEYQLETFSQSNTTNTKVDVGLFVSNPVFKTKTLNDDLVCLKSLPTNFPARKYMEDRKVPLKDLYYTNDFAEYVKNQFPENDKQLYKEPRIVIPFYDKSGNLLGVQGRAIGSSKIKYITIKNEDAPKIFGWNTIDESKRIYVVEGPIDSLFLHNCVASMDATLYRVTQWVGLDRIYTFVYDNEPRNKQILSNMRKTIELGHDVCIWPDNIREKDINDMVKAGMSPAEIQHIIDTNTHNGIMATMKMNQWSKE